MRMRSRVLLLTAVVSIAGGASLMAQGPEERYRWFIGAQGGLMFFGTQSQTQSAIPAAGVHLGVVARRAGLLLSVEEGFGGNEPTQFSITDSVGTFSGPVTFDRVRRYSLTLTGYPVRGFTQPYFGIGFGITQVINPQLTGTFADPGEASSAAFFTRETSSSGFMAVMAGLQFKVGGVSAFGQYQIGTAPSQQTGLGLATGGGVIANNLLRGTAHSFMGGIRISMGSSKEGVRGGGY